MSAYLYQLKSLALALAIVGLSLLSGLSAGEKPLPFVGVVTELAQFQDDLFVHLDTHEDGQGDLWVKILAKASIKDEDGNGLSLDKIEVGSILVIVNYAAKDSYDESDQVTMIVAKDDNNKPFLGDVIQVEPEQKDQNTRAVLLDTNGDQKGDTWLKVRSDVTLKDGYGNQASSSQIVVGEVMVVINFNAKDNYLDVLEAIVVQTDSAKT